MNSPRFLKQLIFGIIYLVIFVAIGYGIYAWIRVEPTCFDGVQNGQEEGVDCGTIACGKLCEPQILPLQILSSKIIQVGDGDYDFVADVFNPNTAYGSGRVAYNLIITDLQGQKNQSGGEFYILPGQTKYIVKSSVKTSEIASAEIEVVTVDWQKMDFQSDSVTFALQNKEYQDQRQAGRSLVSGNVFNNSDYDFEKVDIAVLIFDEEGQITAVNQTDIRTFQAKTQRGFFVEWPLSLGENVGRVDVQITTNLFNNSNFIKTYGDQEKFQKYY